jgi:hypothetical protein
MHKNNYRRFVRQMHNTKDKYCPKCNELFICNVGDIANCQCNTIYLNDDVRQFLAKTNFNCLCVNCLKKIGADVESAKDLLFPTKNEMFVEGVHYYLENGSWVFTELYHLLRGYCCKSGCRHCVYGFKTC